MALTHNSKLADNEPQWGDWIDKNRSSLPDAAFADSANRAFPHHWVENGGDANADGRWTSGTMYLHKGGLNAAWSAANGAHTGDDASPAIKDHLQVHRSALGLDDEAATANASTAKLAGMPARFRHVLAVRPGYAQARFDRAAQRAQILTPINGKNALVNPIKVAGNVAILDLKGDLEKDDSFYSWLYGDTSLLAFQDRVREISGRADIKGVLMNVDSPGGDVFGTPESAALVHELAAKKPVVAFASGQVASAAYWIASAANKIVIGPNTEAGSIGVVGIHVDQSGRDAMMGIKVTEISAGKYKRIASAHEPLSDSGEAYLKEQVNAHYTIFVDEVAKYRGKSQEAVLAMADGKIYVGQQAVDVGMVDSVDSFDNTLTNLINQVNNQALAGGSIMADMEQVVAPTEVSGSEVLAVTQAQIVAGERARIKKIRALTPKGLEALAEELIESGVSAADAAVNFIETANERRMSLLATMVAESAPVVPAETQPEASNDDVLIRSAQAKAVTEINARRGYQAK